jgi:hypothetical protein
MSEILAQPREKLFQDVAEVTNSSAVAIEEVKTKSDREAFIDFAFEKYRDNPSWVPPIRMTLREFFDRKKHPFYQHGDAAFLIARDQKTHKVCGRLGVFWDHDHQRVHQDQTAFFGFFESDARPETDRALFERAEAWAISKGATQLRGPYNMNSNYEAGLLTNCFEESPVVGMNYNGPETESQLLALGFSKEMDLYAYYFYLYHEPPARVMAHIDRLKEKMDIRVRSVNVKKFTQEIELALEIYNDAWSKNWGFIPMNREEFFFRAKEMKDVLDPEIAYFVEVDGKAAAFSLAVPDIHQAQRTLKDGKLFSWRLLSFLWKIKGPFRRKYIPRLRIITLGVKKEFEHLGLGAVLYAEYFKRGKAAGYQSAECSWILENNRLMNRSLLMMKAEHRKTYRILQKPLVAKEGV